MPPHLAELYKPGDLVEIRFSDEAEDVWRPATVRGLQTLGLWVQTGDRRLWFVTNGRRIRPCAPRPAAASPPDG